MRYLKQLEEASSKYVKPAQARILHEFYSSYVNAAQSNGYDAKITEPLLEQFLKMVLEQFQKPHSFSSYHQHITAPFNYYKYGVDFIRPLVILKESKILHTERLNQIASQLAKGDNIILLANHQTELDPQAISLLLEKKHPRLGEEMIFIAGHRVVSDALAIPFSMGRNLLCIYSKKYIENDPETKSEKLQHNQRTMKLMSQLLSEGGKCIYVAPSGGRDRQGANGKIEVAAFDPQSIEMFWLMAQRADHPTHFYPLALSTYDLLPPPENVKKKLGEARVTKATPIHLAFGPEIDMENFPGHEESDKKVRRQNRAHHIWNIVKKDYETISNC